MGFKRLKGEAGAANAVMMMALLPLLMVVVFGFHPFGQMSNLEGTLNRAAGAGARWMASHPGDLAGAKIKAAEVVRESFFTVDASKFNPNTDITLERVDGYAYCDVIYHYKVPFRNIFKLLKGNTEPSVKILKGHGVYKEGEVQ